MRHTSRKTNVNAKQCSLLLQHQKHQHRRRLRGVSSTRTRALKQHALAVALSIVCAIFSSLSTAANTALDQTRMYHLNLPEQTVAAALNSLSEQTDIPVLFPYDIAWSHSIKPVKGYYSIEQALQIMLQDTGLFGGLTDNGVIAISKLDVDQKSKGKNMNTTKKSLLAAMVGLFAAGGMGTVQAQEQVGESARAQSVLDEIVVTAQKREQSLQDVPIAISAFTGQRLEKSGIDDSQSLVMVTPGLSFASDGGMGKVTIRGIGSPFLQGPGVDPSAAVYIDGVYQSRFTSSVFDLMDVERIEVLKGPQGTLYGRNATSGAIKVVSKDPGNEFGGSLSVKAGNYNLQSAKLTLDTPLIEDTLLLRTALVRNTRDGYTEDILNGYESDYEDLKAGRFTLKYFATDNLDITLHGTVINDDGDFGAIKHFVDPDGPFFGDAMIIDDPRRVAHDFGPREAPTRVRAYDATIKWDLGWASLTSITGYTHNEEGPWHEDLDATEINGLSQGNPSGEGGLYFDTKTFTQEVNLTSATNDRLQWITGVYFLRDKPTWLTGIDVPLFSLPLSQYDTRIETEAYAIFGNVTYSLTEKMRLNLGLRYSDEEKERTVSQIIDGVVVRGPESETESWDAVTPKLGLDYFVSDDVMLYVSAGRGFKSGGFQSVGANAFDSAVDPEFIDAYEVGAKTSWLDNRLRFNVNAFYYDYQDLQVLSIVGSDDDGRVITELNNAAKATIQGLDIEMSALLRESLQLDVGISLLDATFDEFLSSLDGEEFDASGNHLPEAPEFTANVGIEYTHPAEVMHGYISLRADYFYSDEKYFDQYERDNATQESFELVNARIAYVSTDESWELALFGKNLTDELVITKSLPFGLIGNSALRDLTPPRTYGASITYNF